MAASGADENTQSADGETYIEKYTKGVSAVESILALDRLRQEVVIKEKLAERGRPLRKTTSVPNISVSSYRSFPGFGVNIWTLSLYHKSLSLTLPENCFTCLLLLRCWCLHLWNENLFIRHASITHEYTLTSPHSVRWTEYITSILMKIQSKYRTYFVNSLRYVQYHWTSSDEWHDPWVGHVTYPKYTQSIWV